MLNSVGINIQNMLSYSKLDNNMKFASFWYNAYECVSEYLERAYNNNGTWVKISIWSTSWFYPSEESAGWQYRLPKSLWNWLEGTIWKSSIVMAEWICGKSDWGFECSLFD